MKFCAICKRTGLVAGKYSNRVRATKFNPTGNKRKQVNLQWAKMAEGGRKKICTRCIKGGKNLEKQSK